MRYPRTRPFPKPLAAKSHPHGPLRSIAYVSHRHYKHRYGAQALDHLVREYNDNIPTRNLHFLMGTMASHPRTFIIIGLLRSGFDPQELARQQQLF